MCKKLLDVLMLTSKLELASKCEKMTDSSYVSEWRKKGDRLFIITHKKVEKYMKTRGEARDNEENKTETKCYDVVTLIRWEKTLNTLHVDRHVTNVMAKIVSQKCAA